MLRRNFLALSGAGLAGGKTMSGHKALKRAGLCGCALAPAAATANAFAGLESKLKITAVKVFGVSLTPDSDRPYVFVKIETDAGVIGWGVCTLEGQASAVMSCINDFRD